MSPPPRRTRQTAGALAAACLIGVGATWLGVLLAYDSYDWGAAHQGLPVSFFVVAVVFAAYLVSGLPGLSAARRGRRRSGPGRGHTRTGEGTGRASEPEGACSPAS